MSIVTVSRRPPLWKPVTGSLINGSHPLVQQMVLCLLGLEGAGKILKNSRYSMVDGAIATPAWTPGRFGMGFKSTAANNDPTIASHPLLDGLFAAGTQPRCCFGELALAS